MTPALEDDAAALPETATRKARGCLRSGCILRGSLGCFSFFFGAGVVFLALLPAALGQRIGLAWEEAFAEAHLGSLNFAEFNLAWFGRQRISGLLRDPEGEYVADAELSMPPILATFQAIGGEALVGPIEVVLDANLEQDARGEFNLARALASREAEGASEIRFTIGDTSIEQGSGWMKTAGVGYLLEVEYWRLRWRSPRLRDGGVEDLVLVLDEGSVKLPDRGAGELRVSGRVEGQGPLEVSMTFEHLEDLLAGRSSSDTCAWSVQGLSTSALTAIGPPDLPYERALGSTIGALGVRTRAGGSEGFTLELRTQRVNIDLAGRMRGDEALVSMVAGADDPEVNPTQASFALEGFWVDDVVAALLPFVGAVAAEQVAVGKIALSDFSLPRDGALRGLSADLHLSLGRVSYTLLPHLDGVDDWAGWPSPEAVAIEPINLRLDAGVVTYEDLVLDLGEERLVVRGRHDLVEDALDVVIDVPAALLGEGPGRLRIEGVDPSASDVRLRLRGPAKAPVFEIILDPPPTSAEQG